MIKTIRPYRGSDEAELLRIWQTTLSRDRIDAVTWRTRVLLDPNFLPEGLLLAEQADGSLAGFVLSLTRQVPLYGQGLEPETGWITAFGVAPTARRRGIGRALFAAALARMAALGRRQVLIAPYTPNYFTPGVDVAAYPAAISFLQRQGWQIRSQPIAMQADLADFEVVPAIVELEAQLAAAGISVRPVTATDLPTLMPFIARTFGWDWYRFAQEYLLTLFGSGADDLCLYVAVHASTDGEEIVGYCQQRRERFGPFGVDPALRGQGIGRVLLFRCLEAMRARGFHCAWFLWTGANAARLYAQAGFRQTRQFAILAYPLTETVS
jgi:ribosomal protein S18 acetylase RimI-like enzyme